MKFSNIQYSIINYSPCDVHDILRTYFITGILYLLTLFTHFTHLSPPCPHLCQPPVCSLYLWIFFFVLFLDSTSKCDHMVFVFV